jgi:hypothetical protein
LVKIKRRVEVRARLIHNSGSGPCCCYRHISMASKSKGTVLIGAAKRAKSTVLRRDSCSRSAWDRLFFARPTPVRGAPRDPNKNVASRRGLDSIDLAQLDFFFRRQGKAWLDFRVARDQRGGVLSNCGAMLESMSGTAADNPGVLKYWMTVD